MQRLGRRDDDDDDDDDDDEMTDLYVRFTQCPQAIVWLLLYT